MLSLRGHLTRLGQENSAFADASQAKEILTRTRDQLLPGFRRFHWDLLFHLEDREIFGRTPYRSLLLPETPRKP